MTAPLSAPTPFRVNTYIRYLKARIAGLEARLNALGLEAEDVGAWIVGLTAQERQMIELLSDAYPRFVSLYALEERLVGRDHTLDRDVRIVRVLVSRIRTKLGKDVILTQQGIGYGLGIPRAEIVKRAQERIGDPLKLGDTSDIEAFARHA